MKVHSFKLTIQDLEFKSGKKEAMVMGTLLLDEGKKEKKQPVYTPVNFHVALSQYKELKQIVKQMTKEVLEHHAESLKPKKKVVKKTVKKK
jgi:hypothetical protein